jgi:hypothetical protein
LGRKIKQLENQVGELSAELQATRKELQDLQASKPKTAARSTARKSKVRRKSAASRKK